MINVWCIEKGNAAGILAQAISSNGLDLPPALPWVEPTINNLWLEACSSHLYGNYQASIIATSVLLELVLRMVLADSHNVPSIREDHEQLFEKETLSSVISTAKRVGVLSGDSKKWWESYRDHIRNKICHGDLLHILDDCRSVRQFESYFDPCDSPSNVSQYCYESTITHPGAFHHKLGRRFSKAFLKDAFSQLTLLINQTEWTEYEDWWESQKHAYESFFAYDWNYGSLINGVQAARKPFSNAAK